jgi:hypothetical protein
MQDLGPNSIYYAGSRQKNTILISSVTEIERECEFGCILYVAV